MKRFDFMTIRSDLSGRIFSTAALIAVFMLCAAQAWAATISVNTADIAAISGDGKCSLSEAIQAANTDTAVDACPAGSGADVIELQANTIYTQNVVITQLPGETLAQAAQRESLNYINIESTITINGHGSTVSKTGSALFLGYFLNVRSNGNLTLNDLTVHYDFSAVADTVSICNQQGILTINNSIFEKIQTSQSFIAAIANYGGKIIVNKTTINQIQVVNQKQTDIVCGIYNYAATDTSGTLISEGDAQINDCIISGTTGVGIINGNGTMNITNGVIKENVKGGIQNAATLIFKNSSISDNQGFGGIRNFNVNAGKANITIINSTITGNSSTSSGAGVTNLLNASQIKIINSTITNNKTGIPDENGTVSETANGGGICNAGNYSGQSGTVEVINSIIAGNSDLSTTTVHPDVSGPITGNHNNLIGNITGATGTIGTGSDIVNPNPLLDTLKDNGGFTQTHALSAGSPAIDKGDNAICAGADVGNIDQRGKTRPYGTTCDIGSYEYRPYNTDVILEAISNPSPICPGDIFDVTFKISSTQTFFETEGYLHFDPSVLKVNSISKKFVGVFPSGYDNAKGDITFGASGYSGFGNIPEFFTVNFKVIGMNSGSTLLDFDDSKNRTYDTGYEILSQTSEDVTIVIAYPTTDKDADGVLNTVENGAPDGDGNGDGTFDSLQNNVTSLPSVVTNNYITLEVSPASCAVKNVLSKTEQAAGSGNEDPLSDYPQGLIEFDIACDTANIRVFYHGITVETVSGADVITVNANKIPLTSLSYRKYGPTPPGFTQSSWYSLPVVQFGKQTIGGNNILTASFTLKDGELGDDTGKDGKIYDAGGLAIVSASLTVSKTGSGTVTSIPAGISCGTDCTENYLLNTQVTLTAAPAEGYVFKEWGGACSGTSAAVTVTADSAKTCTATFAACDSAWLNSLIDQFRNEPVTNPPRSIYQYDYNGKTVYYVPPICCDQYSTLYDACGNVICAPDGGFTGNGDGQCPDFFTARKNEKIILEPIKNITAGDIDNKGNVNLADAILALQVVAGLNPPDVNIGADVNNDGKIGLEEVIYILQKVAGLR